ncbi:Transporter [Entamoeba marina]
MNKIISFLRSLFDNFPRQLLCGFLFNSSSYLFWIVVPLLANEIGANATQLALLQTVAYGIYTIIVPFGGKISDKLNAFVLLRLSLILLIIADVIVAIFSTSLIMLYVSCAFWAFSAFLFWPSTVGTIGLESPLGKEALHSGLFGVSWSIGKSVGYAAGGVLKSILGASGSLYVAIVINVIVIIVYPYRHVHWLREKIKMDKQAPERSKKDIDVPIEMVNMEESKKDIDIPIEMIQEPEDKENGSSDNKSGSSDNKNNLEEKKNEEILIPEDLLKEIQEGAKNKDKKSQKIKVKWSRKQLKNKSFIYIGYIQQLAIFGALTIVTNQYLKVCELKDIGIPVGNPIDNFLGFNFAILFLAQTVAFVLMSLTDSWAYRRSLFLLTQTAFIIFLMVLCIVYNPYIIFCISIVGGLCSGFASQTATYYSLRASEESKSLFIGISECVASSSSAVLPLIAGLLSQQYDPFASFYFAIIFMLVCMILGEFSYHFVYYINRRRQSKRNDVSDIPAFNDVNIPVTVEGIKSSNSPSLETSPNQSNKINEQTIESPPLSQPNVIEEQNIA